MQLIFLQKKSKHLLLMVELDEDEDDSRPMPVSYTHLTQPTILRV